MAIQLTLEQEQRIQAIVATGAYRSTGEAIEAAVAAVELFWETLRRETGQMAADSRGT